ncbi:MAG TPA: MFS transporter [Polyangiales bacterium]|nr:MFS transporter [Polyangiales bacterium]
MTGLMRQALNRGTLAIGCVLAALVLVVLDAVIANVALPAIARALQVSPAESVRVVTAYQMALVMTLLPCAAIGESWGYRPVYTAGVALFVFGSALCALAPSLSFLVAARFIQGLGGAAIMALGVALLRYIVSEGELGAAIGWNTLAVALASAAGPALGALVLSSASWRWLFAINLPLGALVLLSTRVLPDVVGTARKLDRVSLALNAAGFAALVAGTELIPGYVAAATLVLAAAIFGLFALVRREMGKPAPIIPLDLLREPSFRVSVIASVCGFIGQSAAMISLPFYLQHDLGQDVFRTGLLMTPWPLTVALVAPIAGRLVNRVSGASMCFAGGALLALGLACAALLPLHVMPLALIPCVALCGLGFGLFNVSNNRTMFLAAPRARSGAAGGMQGTARLLGQTLGAVVVTALLTALPLELAPRVGLGVAAVLTLVAGVVSMLRATSRSEPRDAERREYPPRAMRQGLRQLLLDLLSALTFVLLFAVCARPSSARCARRARIRLGRVAAACVQPGRSQHGLRCEGHDAKSPFASGW